MDEVITEELAERYLTLRSVDGGTTAIQQRLGFYPDHYRCQAYCEGFLEGLKQARKEAEGLVKIIQETIPVLEQDDVDPDYAEKVMVIIHDDFVKALATYQPRHSGKGENESYKKNKYLKS